MTTADANDLAATLRRRHLRLGWWGLFAFACLGLGLEAMHGFKVGAYLDAQNEPRRVLWRLAHAHGVGLALVQLAFASLCAHTAKPSKVASACLVGAFVAMPLGFLLGGAWPLGGDPGAGIALVPLGAVLLLLGLALAARSSSSLCERD